jgi:hypothetical protein
MKVRITDDGIIIVPETDFEEDYLRKDFKGNPKSFLKHGVTLKELIGLKICKSEPLKEIPKKPAYNEDIENQVKSTQKSVIQRRPST